MIIQFSFYFINFIIYLVFFFFLIVKLSKLKCLIVIFNLFKPRLSCTICRKKIVLSNSIFKKKIEYGKLIVNNIV